MNKIAKNIFIKLPLYLLIIIGLIFGLNFLFSPSRSFLPNVRIVKAGDTQNLIGWAWSENVGWFSFNSVDCDENADGISDGVPTGCPPAGTSIPNYGVNINPISGYFSGYAWSENVGWLSFNRSETGTPPSNDPCPSDNCVAKVVPSGLFRKDDNNVDIEGWARVLAACDSVPCVSSSGGWDGWVRFDHGFDNEPIFSASEDKLHNWAWDGDVIGWLSFNSDEFGGLIQYAVKYNCRCTVWVNQGCGVGCSKITEMKQTRSCTPSACSIESQCIDSSVCYHKKCENNRCISLAGPESDPDHPECATDNDCLLKPWLGWKWWEVVPKLNK